MAPDDVAKQLHDKATRGTPLTGEEQALLQEWYARLDQEESRHLAAGPPPTDLAALRQEIQNTLSGIIAVSQKIQALKKNNEDLRKEILALQQRLPRKAS
jgi:predicted  nucleic acid-binding Zn-ribbon protein